MQDTFRAEWAWQILLAPERISGMVQSMLQDYKEGGWLPMWKNIVGTSVCFRLFVLTGAERGCGTQRQISWCVFRDAGYSIDER